MRVPRPFMTRPLPGITEGLSRPRTTMARRRLRPTMPRRQFLRITPRRPRPTVPPRIRRITPPGLPRRRTLRLGERDTTQRRRFSPRHLRTTVLAPAITHHHPAPTTTHVKR